MSWICFYDNESNIFIVRALYRTKQNLVNKNNNVSWNQWKRCLHDIFNGYYILFFDTID